MRGWKNAFHVNGCWAERMKSSVREMKIDVCKQTIDNIIDIYMRDEWDDCKVDGDE